MKNSLIAITLLSVAVQISAQTVNTPFAVVQRDANSRVWARTNYERGPAGQTITNVHRYIELATGLHYQSDGQWVESKEEITIQPTGGAAAVQGQHQVYFPADIYNGVLEVVTPDGHHLKSRPLAVSYDDGSHTVFIATLKHSQGWLTSSNQVTYRDAFTDIDADIVCTYRRGGFECDLVFRQQPPGPEAYKLDGSASTLQLVTEFFNTQDPQEIPATYDEWFGLQDNALKFGKLTMTQGKAFEIGTRNTEGRKIKTSTPVYKRWLHLEGRNFLIEEVPLVYLADDLKTLPAAANVLSQIAGKIPIASNQLRMPPTSKIVSATNQILVASVNLEKKPGVVLDYNEINSDQTDFTFENGVTYYISGGVNINGTATFSPGAVLKYSEGSPGDPSPTLYCNGAIVCDTTPDNPAIFTSVNDDSVGAPISGISTSVPARGFANYILQQDSSPLRNLRFYYAGYAVMQMDPEIWNSEFHDCEISADALDSNITLHNVLFSKCNYFEFQDNFGGAVVRGENVTIDQGGTFWPETMGGSITLTNSILSNDGNGHNTVLGGMDFENMWGIRGLSNGVYNTSCRCWDAACNGIVSTISPYSTSGGAEYYLLPGSPFHDAGSTNISTNLLSVLQTMTTYSPEDGSLPDINVPDLGYHYSVNEDSDHDGLPDSWEWKYYGSFSKTGTDLDDEANGNTVLYDYQNGIDPRAIEFSIGITNNYIRTNVTAMTLNVTAGTPFSIAVLVASTNFNGASWSSYTSSNLTQTLGTTDGVYTVWIGLRGSQTASKQIWHKMDFTLDRVPPMISITNIVSGSTVPLSLLQVQGWVSEPAASIVYDLTNATGLITNQEAYLTGASVDTNLTRFTTNYFQAYDIFLADGTNTMTFHATDLAGNTSTTNLIVVLDTGTTTNPAITVNWPNTNNPIAGTNFVLSGTVDDPTATVTVSGIGFVNLVATVERNGRFTIPGVPLLASNNTFTVTVTNKSGLGLSASGSGPSRSSVQITVDPIQSSQISHDFMTLTGTVSDTNKDVWVNGVQATVNTNGTWQADNVPVHDDAGSQQLNLGAYPTGSDPNTTQPSGVQNPIVPLPAVVQATAYTRKYYFLETHSCGGNSLYFHNNSWQREIGGWDVNDFLVDSRTDTSIWGTPDYLPVEDWANISTARGYSGKTSSELCVELGDSYFGIETESVQTSIELVAGGPAVPGEMQLIRLTGSVSADAPILSSDIKIQGQAMVPTATNDQVGELYVAIPAGSKRTLPVRVSGSSSYSFDVHADGKNVKILANGINLSTNTPEFCVGQQIVFTLDGLPSYSNHITHWKLPEKYVNQLTNISLTCTSYWTNPDLLTNLPSITNWYVNGTGGTISVGTSLQLTNGQTVALAAKGAFTIYRPTFSSFSTTNPGYPSSSRSFLWDGTILSYGNQNTGEHGLYWSITVNSKHNGKIGVLQLVKAQYTQNYGWCPDCRDTLDTHGDFWLDGSPTPTYHDPNNYQEQLYLTNTVSSQSISLDDQPEEELWIASPINVRLTGEFIDYVRFQPNGGIFVTIATNGWTMEGVATVSSGLSTNNTPAPTFPINSDSWPTWTNLKSSK